MPVPVVRLCPGCLGDLDYVTAQSCHVVRFGEGYENPRDTDCKVNVCAVCSEARTGCVDCERTAPRTPRGHGGKLEDARFFALALDTTRRHLACAKERFGDGTPPLYPVAVSVHLAAALHWCPVTLAAGPHIGAAVAHLIELVGTRHRSTCVRFLDSLDRARALVEARDQMEPPTVAEIVALADSLAETGLSARPHRSRSY